jgi:peptidase M1-like protein
MRLTVWGSFATSLLLWGAALDGQTASEYTAALSALQNVAPRSDSASRVRGLILRRDVMEFHLDSGRLYLLTPVAARTVGAVFVGNGSISYSPPLAVERGQLWRVLGDSSLRAPLSSVVFFFSDSTLAEFGHHLNFARDSFAPQGPTAPVSDALNRLVDGSAHNTAPGFMTALLNGTANGFFYAYIVRARGEDVMFEVDPSEAEPIVLLRKGRVRGQRTQIVSQSPRSETLPDTERRLPNPATPLSVPAYEIESWIDKGLGFRAVATLHVTARSDVRWARLVLFDELHVDSVLAPNGSRDSIFRARTSDELWIRFGTPLKAGDSTAIRVAYHGGLIGFGSLLPQSVQTENGVVQLRLSDLDSWFFLRETETWYPRYDFWENAAVELTFHIPDRFQLASIGRLIESRVDGDVRTTHWVAERPTNQISFSIGEFKEIRITDPRIPPITLQVNLQAHRRLDAMLFEPRNALETVGADVAGSLAFFTKAFGPPLFSRYYATEIPYGHGQAFPGLIHLSWFTFQSNDGSGFNEIFRAHEMAHQWWGIGVEPAGYRDVWLSEGFSDFAGLWYMQTSLGDERKFLRQLKDLSDAIRARHDQAPPLALGTRTGEQDPNDYQTIVYGKGAWVLQMLRNLMLDLRTKSESIFTETMQDFYAQYRGRAASTQDFQRVVEDHMGMSMKWFFDEWLDGTAIPTYVESWRVDSTAQHPHTLHVRVRQEGVPPSFLMPVPLLIKFADSSETFVRIVVRGPQTDAEVPLPAVPTRLELNPLGSVLAVVKQEDWH